jgi:hypothetical protein
MPVVRIPLVGCGVVAVLGVAGCNVHPLPDDFPRESTAAIVQKIRCEAAHARDALVSKDPAGYKRLKLSEAEIGYHFTFTISETNNASASAGFVLPLFSRGETFSLGINAGDKRDRIGEREFTFVETFGKIGCDSNYPAAVAENRRYPITGKIGLEETILTFGELAGLRLLHGARPQQQHTGSGAGGSHPGGNNGNGGKLTKPDDFTDSLTFTTTVNAGLSPQIKLKPIGSGFELGDAKADLTGERKDKHALVVTLVLPEEDAETVRIGLRRLPGEVTPADKREYTRRKARDILERQRSISTQRKILDLLEQP